MLDLRRVTNFLRQYVVAYRQRYHAFTAPPPDGLGYPPILVSPFLSPCEVTCYVLSDGHAIMVGPHDVREVDASWKAFCQCPILEHLPDDVNNGMLPAATAADIVTLDDGTTICACLLDSTLGELIQRLTFGCFKGTERDPLTPYGECSSFRRMPFISGKTKLARYIEHLETHQHNADVMFDPRSLMWRIEYELRRDFQLPAGSFNQQVIELGNAIHGFAQLLQQYGNDPEYRFHEYIAEHPLLLDVYGKLVSKPRWKCATGKELNGKDHVEPDFVIVYGGCRYRLVELERPQKGIATEKGHPRSEVTQASYQIAEWRVYIDTHNDRLQKDFPNITSRAPGLLIIGRNTPKAVGAQDLDSYRRYLSAQFNDIEVLTYDELLRQAIEMFARITATRIAHRDSP